MDDLISRQAAIDALAREQSLVERPITETRWFDLGLRKAQEVLSKLPSAQLERKKGKWIETDDGWDGTYYVCSECGCPWTLIDGTPEDNGMNYCPNCGSFNGGEE